MVFIWQALTAQSITLFAAMILNDQEITNTSMDCSGGVCKRSISDSVMDLILTILQVRFCYECCV